MATIGSFKKVGNELQGEIVTLSVQTKGVRVVPEPSRGNDNAPSHRVFVGRAEIGAAWSKRSNEGRDYLSLKLDDPSFNAPHLRQPLRRRGRRGLQPDLVPRPQAQQRISRNPPARPRPDFWAGLSTCLSYLSSSPALIQARDDYYRWHIRAAGPVASHAERLP